MNTESITCRKVDKIEKVGDFTFDDLFGMLYIWIPGLSGPDAIRIERGHPTSPRVWGWDGDLDLPTLTPSIHAPGQWHGYLTAGQLISC